MATASDRNPGEAREAWAIFRDSRGAWRWRRMDLQSGNVAQSPKGYATQEQCVESARRDGYRGYDLPPATYPPTAEGLD